MKKKASFSDNIIRTIHLIMSLSFATLFLGSTILLFTTEDDINVFLAKTAGTFALFIALYLFSSFYLSNSIRKQFAPLDRLAYGLKDNSIEIIGDNDDIKIFAKQLKNDMEKMDSLKAELRETRDSLDDVYLSNERTINDSLDIIDECKKLHVKNVKKIKNMKEKLSNENILLEEIMPVSVTLKNDQNNLKSNIEGLNLCLSKNLKKHEEIKQDNLNAEETYNIIADSLKDSVELLDSLFSEISVLQNTASRISLYSMNTTIEAARTGILNISVNNALEELKELSKNIQVKSDDVALLAIRSKNSLNMALEQSLRYKEVGEANLDSSRDSLNSLMELSEFIKRTMMCADDITFNAGKILVNLEKIDEINGNLISDNGSSLDISDHLGNKLFDIDKSLKNNDF